MTTLRFMSWNWNCFSDGRNHRKADLIRRLAPDVVALQEVDKPGYDDIERLLSAWTPVMPPVWDDPEESVDLKGNRLPSTALLISEELTFEPADAPALDVWKTAPPRAGLEFGDREDDANTPEARSIVGAHVHVGGTSVFCVSAHPPHAAGRGDERVARILRKRRTYEVLREYVRGRNVVLGMDANAWIDPEPEEVGKFDVALLPLAARTRDLPELDQTDIGLFLENGFVDGEADEAEPRDALRIWLGADKERRNQILQRRPFGPWAITYNRSSNFARPDRRDLVMVSKDVKVLEVEHSYEDSLAAGSDHSYVLCDLEI